MGYISQIKLPSGSVYEIKDAWSRGKIGEISSMIQGGVHYLGKTTTALSGDGDTTSSVIIGGDTIPAKQGDMVSLSAAGKQDLEFIFNGSAWYELGSTGSLKALAFKDSASGSTTYTPHGTLTDLSFSGSEFKSTGSYKPAGTVSLTGTQNLATTVTSANGDITYTPAGTISAAFSGSEFKSTGSYKPAGTVSLTGTQNLATTVTSANGDITYTPQGTLTNLSFSGSEFKSTGSYKPAGTVTAPTINLNTPGTSATVHNPTANTVVSAFETYVSAQAPSTAIPYWDVSSDAECLILKGITYKTGDSIGTTDLAVKTGDASYQSTQPQFTGSDATLSVYGTATGSVSGNFSGTGVRLTTGTINVPTGANFTGSDATLSVYGTATGSITGTKFTGTGVRLTTGTINVPTGANFTGTDATLSVYGTATGTVSGNFSGTSATISITAS